MGAEVRRDRWREVAGGRCAYRAARGLRGMMLAVVTSSSMVFLIAVCLTKRAARRTDALGFLSFVGALAVAGSERGGEGEGEGEVAGARTTYLGKEREERRV